MSHQSIHRVYTENKRRATIVRLISKQFDNFTLQPYYRLLSGQAGEIHRAGRRGCQGIAGEMAGRGYSRNKSASVGTGDHLEGPRKEDNH